MADEQDEPKVKYAEGFVFVNVYELDRIYGGAEEGGWYFDAGTLLASRQVLEADAEQVVAEFSKQYPDVATANELLYQEWEAQGCEGRCPRVYRCDSVCYSGGDYRVYIENQPGADFPEYTPHYE